MRLQYFSRPSKKSGEIRYEIHEGALQVEWLASGKIERLELSKVCRVLLTTWRRKGCCVLVGFYGEKIRIPSHSYDDSGSREDQAEEYTRFIDSLHEHLEILSPGVEYEGRNYWYLVTGISTVVASLLLGSLFGIYFTLGEDVGSGVEWYRWFLLTFGILATCGLVVGSSLFRKGLPRPYNPGMAPCYLLPASKNPRVSVGTGSGLPANIQFYGRQNMVFPMTDDRRRTSRFTHIVQRR